MNRAEPKTKKAFVQPKTNQTNPRWNEGLELARATAIALVVYSHGLPILRHDTHWLLINRLLGLNEYFKPGWWGVRIFFALSGYLIGRQVIETLASGNLREAIFFTLRRWLRTIPTYWILLAITCAVTGINLFSMETLQNALFIQSSFLSTRQATIIEVAWSLAIEEWSYLLGSLVVIAGTTFWGQMATKRAAWLLGWLAIFALGESIIARLWASEHQGLTWEILKKSTNLQLDSLSLGGLLSALERLSPQIFRILTTHPRIMGITSFAGMSLTGWWLNSIQNEGEIRASSWAWLSTIGYPLSSMLCCCLLCSVWSIESRSLKLWIRRPIKTIAEISYSLYLTHLSVFKWIEINKPTTSPSGAFLIYVLISIVLGWFCWLCLEKPLISVRRHLKTHLRA